MIHTRSTNAKAFYQNVFINQGRRLWARRWLDTVVVITVNDVDLGLRDVITYDFRSTIREIIKYLNSGGSMDASLKLKRIDGRAPPGAEPAA